MLTSIAGRSVVVTGASKGIGKGIAGVFARAGANVVVAGRDADTGERAAQELGARYVQADISKAEDCERMAAEAGDVDVLCANAGIFPDVKLADMTEADIDGIFATNVKGTMLSVKACLPALERSGHGRVIVTSSITGPITGPITGYPGWTHYGASKAGQLGFMRTAAIELAPLKITVNAVLPGNIRTEGLDSMGPEYAKKMSDSVPQGRLGSVEDIAYAALFLASDEAAYITGQTIIIDGGQILPESLMALEEMAVS